MDLLVDYEYYAEQLGEDYGIPVEGFDTKSLEAETAILSVVKKPITAYMMDIVKKAICWQIAFNHLNNAGAGSAGGEVASESYSVGGESESKSYVAGGKGKAKTVNGVTIAPYAYLTLSQNGIIGEWRKVATW